MGASLSSPTPPPIPCAHDYPPPPYSTLPPRHRTYPPTYVPVPAYPPRPNRRRCCRLGGPGSPLYVSNRIYPCDCDDCLARAHGGWGWDGGDRQEGLERGFKGGGEIGGEPFRFYVRPDGAGEGSGAGVRKGRGARRRGGGGGDGDGDDDGGLSPSSSPSDDPDDTQRWHGRRARKPRPPPAPLRDPRGRVPPGLSEHLQRDVRALKTGLRDVRVDVEALKRRVGRPAGGGADVGAVNPWGGAYGEVVYGDGGGERRVRRGESGVGTGGAGRRRERDESYPRRRAGADGGMGRDPWERDGGGFGGLAVVPEEHDEGRRYGGGLGELLRFAVVLAATFFP